ncbi:MAG TPA: aldolase/citrate lyase family protein, partial [Tepidisphaeraceae bacterium]|nr:aldolase/citrate lyase family protein [Tepidisphaeraceae bacterium]
MATTANANAAKFEAGRFTSDTRSDCRVVFEPRSSGGIELELQSKVAAYYGNSISTDARSTLAALGIEHARLLIEDAGALPYTIAARIEAAVKRAGLAKGRHHLPQPSKTGQGGAPATARDRMRRSRLYLPGSEPKYFANAALHGPDAIILDLEDSVHPADKDSARLLVRNALRAIDFASCERMVRINQLPLGLEDLDEIVRELPDLILIPKVEEARQVVEVDKRIAEIQARHKIDRSLWLMPILESALGIENAFAIATASPRNVALTIGLEDYTADLGVVKTATGAESLFARQRLVNAARGASLQAIDSVYGDIGDLGGLLSWGRNARAMGFEGMGCVHPLQIAVIHQAFAPSEAEIERALKIVAAYDDAKKRGLGVVS